MSYPDQELRLPCGCTKDNGSWSPCAQHRGFPSSEERADHLAPADAVTRLLAEPALTQAAPVEPAEQHIKNALMILAVADTDAAGNRTLTAAEVAGIRRRLDRAVTQLERGGR